MSTEQCKLCNQDSTPWVHINGHICQDCYANTKRLWVEDKPCWIDVKDKLPEHHQTILACTPKGQSICVFVDGKIMKAVIGSIGVTPTDKEASYYFCSQEIKGAVLNGVTHWMPLLDSPHAN